MGGSTRDNLEGESPDFLGPMAPPGADDGALARHPAWRWVWGLLAFGGFAAVGLLDTRPWDSLITGVFQRLPSWALLRTAEAVTVFGSVQLTGAMVLWTAWAAGRQGGWRPALWIAIPFLIAVPLELFLKVVGPHLRSGPPVPPGGVVWAWFRVPSSHSFPSGHMLRATYLIGVLLAWEAGTRTSPRRPYGVWALALGGLLLYGASQVYLGNHWTSDVAGGCLLGVALVVIASKQWRW